MAAGRERRRCFLPRCEKSAAPEATSSLDGEGGVRGGPATIEKRGNGSQSGVVKVECHQGRNGRLKHSEVEGASPGGSELQGPEKAQSYRQRTKSLRPLKKPREELGRRKHHSRVEDKLQRQWMVKQFASKKLLDGRKRSA